MSIVKDTVFVEKSGKFIFYIDVYIKYVVDSIFLSEEFSRQLLLGIIDLGSTDFEFTYTDNIGIIYKSKLSFYTNTYTNKHNLKNNYIEYKDYCIKLDTLWVDAEFLMYNFETLNYFNYTNHYNFDVVVTTAVKSNYPTPLTLNLYRLGINQYDLQVDLSKYFDKTLYIFKSDILTKYIEWNLVNDANIICNISNRVANINSKPYTYLYENNRKKVYINIAFDYSYNNGIDDELEFLSNFIDNFTNCIKGDNLFIVTIETKDILKKEFILTSKCYNLLSSLYKFFDKVVFSNSAYKN